MEQMAEEGPAGWGGEVVLMVAMVMMVVVPHQRRCSKAVLHPWQAAVGIAGAGDRPSLLEGAHLTYGARMHEFNTVAS
eukprot:364889-Chlamydomonas_euryale.AAC.4